MKITKTSNPELGYKDIDTLYAETEQHRTDVARVMTSLAMDLINVGCRHDWSKITYFEQFAKDTLEREEKPNFKDRDWYKIHTKEERHHLNAKIPDEVDLIDVLEFICDCVVAGLSRTGEVRKDLLGLPVEVLRDAYWNTINKIIDEVELEE